MKSLVEKKLKSVCIFRGNAVSFHLDTVRLPSGRTASREYMGHPGAVCVVPFLNRKKIILLRQYRHPVREVIYEFPAGKLDGKESPLACAKRELLEETGYRAGRLKKINSFWPTAAFATEVIHVYAAWDLSAGPAQPDQDEALEAFAMDFNQVLEWIKSGKIKDSKSIIAASLIQCFGLFPPIR